eukprot:CAMPEP_0170137978 /NCGR_PEP_ID=MMETSP0033_2-20121228/4569_1 /TAXON_ID=195969 /ORGANISM="Dolichomastix tenuilepis, Strain CCMP3274" /LENGTH=119 /DNA_ID=CAMNT_0010373923 /DNA_START=32 /DNA_END=391 /DNA_ORIENTATION=-
MPATLRTRIAAVPKSRSQARPAQRSPALPRAPARGSARAPARFAVETEQATTTSEEEPTDAAPASEEMEGANAPLLKPGQGTAIATGAISLIISFGYLAMAEFFGSRELLPPPIEALGP